jgi:hypothetical protein
VRPLRDARELALLKSRQGWFLEYLSEEALEPSPPQAVTQALIERLRASGRFEQVIGLAAEQEVPEAFSPPGNSVPAEVVLEGEVQAFYAERNTVSGPFLSMLMAPLGGALAALSGLRFVPTPASPFLPVNYHANLTIQVRLCDSRAGIVVWERTVEGIGELSETAAADFFRGKEDLMKEAATLALQAGVEKFARQLPSAEWFKARWPRTPSRGPGTSAPAPR